MPSSPATAPGGFLAIRNAHRSAPRRRAPPSHRSATLATCPTPAAVAAPPPSAVLRRSSRCGNKIAAPQRGGRAGVPGGARHRPPATDGRRRVGVTRPKPALGRTGNDGALLVLRPLRPWFFLLGKPAELGLCTVHGRGLSHQLEMARKRRADACRPAKKKGAPSFYFPGHLAHFLEREREAPWAGPG